jgi:streptogramin lyase
VGRIGAGDELGSERPCGIAVGDGAVWVATLSGNVARINTRSNRLGTLVETEEAACVAAGAGGVWVTQPERGAVVRIDPVTNEIVAEIPLDGFPQGIAIGYGSVWVAAADPPEGDGGGVSRIDPRSNEVVRTILVPNLPEFVATGANMVWATSNNGTVAEIDPRTNQLISPIRDRGDRRERPRRAHRPRERPGRGHRARGRGEPAGDGIRRRRPVDHELRRRDGHPLRAASLSYLPRN